MLSAINLIPPMQTGSQMFNEDKYTVPATTFAGGNRIIKFVCPNKKARIKAIMNSGFDFNVSSQWNSLTDGKLVGLINKGVNAINGVGSSFGVSVSQPWQNRKIYSHTNPLSFNVTFNLLAINNAQNEVWDPAMTLISFLYPREVDLSSLKGSTNGVLNTIGKIANIGNTAKEGLQTLAQNMLKVPKGADGTSILDTALNAFGVYSVPGPSLIFKGTSEELGTGDPVQVFLGKKIVLGNCYIENVSIKFDDVADKDGYPLSAECSVKISCADNLTVKQNGGFMIIQLAEPNKELSNLLDALGEGASDLIKDAVNVLTKTLNSYKILGTGGL